MMKLIQKSLNRKEWLGIKSEVKSIRVNDETFCGTVGLLKIIDIDEPIIIKNEIKNICIADIGYYWLQFAPKNAHWWLTIAFDDNDELIESYFDITRENNFDDEFNPTFYDMFLDISFNKVDEPVILDEDELKEALNLNLITNTEFEMALLLAKKIVNCYNSNKANYYDWIYRFYQMLRH